MLRLQRILKLIDLGASDDTSLADCLALANKFDAELHLLHVVVEHAIPRFGSRKRLQQVLDQLESFELPIEGTRVVRELREGNIARCIVQYVQEHDIDLVVVDQHNVAALGVKNPQAVINELREELAIPLLLTASHKLHQTRQVELAAKTLHDHFGHSLAGEFAQTHGDMLQKLKSKLSLNDEDAAALFENLKANGMLEWRDSTGGSDTQASGQWQLKRPAMSAGTAAVLGDPEFEAESTPAVSLIQRAIETNATDIHIDPAGAEGYSVQFRVDGRMQEFCRMQKQIAGVAMKQIKLMANISLADPFHPCESRLQLPDSIKNYEVRVTTAPVAAGEAIAMRLINCDKLNLPLNDLGLSSQSFACVHRMLHQRSGLILIAGPTGAGKTTTAYSIIHVLFAEHQKIISIEDPVELVVPYMRQISVDERHNFSLRNGLSTILRMDPDAVFVGEIRDSEAAHVAFQAAACGKRAFSTIHMRDVSATLSAMREFNIDPKTLADNLSGVIAQRLVRRICQACCQHTPLTRHELEMFESQGIDPPAELARARGCPDCRGTGYNGRIGVFEAVVIEGDIAEAIRNDRHETELRQLVRNRGVGLFSEGLLKVRDGITTAEELQETSWLVESPSLETDAVQDDETYQRAAPSGRASTIR